MTDTKSDLFSFFSGSARFGISGVSGETCVSVAAVLDCKAYKVDRVRLVYLMSSLTALRCEERGTQQQGRHPMRENLRPGERFPDIELPNQDWETTKLSSLMGGFPIIVAFSRGYF